MEKRPNIIILILDAVRACSVSAYGYSRPTTPNLDRFAGEHILFRRAYTPGTWTIPTHTSPLTGLYPAEHGIENIEANRLLHKSIVPLQTALRHAGYHTAAFSQNILFSPGYHFNDFDEFQEPHAFTPRKRAASGRRTAHAKRGQLDALRRYFSKVRGVRVFADGLADWITAQKGTKPFFLAANLAHVHSPWAPPPGMLIRSLGLNLRHLLRRQISAPNPFHFNSGLVPVTDRHRQLWRELYDASLTHTDRIMGRLLKRLEQWPGWENTIFVVTADHGEMLGEHDDIFGHTLTLNHRVIHVPLILKHPDYCGPIRVEGVVQLHDLFPSIVGWAGARHVPPEQLSRPTLDTFINAPSAQNGIAFAEEDYTGSYNVIAGLKKANPKMPANKFPLHQTAVIDSRHKLIEFDDRVSEIYNLETSLFESEDLSHTRDPGILARVASLSEKIAAWRANLHIFPPRTLETTEPLDPELQERLSLLGYLD